jgi:hypothetical protein
MLKLMNLVIPTKENVLPALEYLYPSLDLVSVFSPISNSQILVYGGLLRDIALGRPSKEADLLIVKDQPIKEFEKDIENVLQQNNFTYLGKVSHPDSANYQYLPPGKADLKSVIDINIARHTDYSGDFTVNSLYIDIVSGKLYDIYGGLRDIEKGILRASLDPYETFRHNPLRVFRAVKCVCQFGFEIESVTKSALIKSVPLTYNTLAFVADNQQTLLGEWMLDNIFRGLAYDPECYFSYHSNIRAVNIFRSFLKDRLGDGSVFTENVILAVNPFIKGQSGSYEEKISIFLSSLIDSLNVSDPQKVFNSILDTFGFKLPNKYHPVGIDSLKLQYTKEF